MCAEVQLATNPTYKPSHVAYKPPNVEWETNLGLRVMTEGVGLHLPSSDLCVRFWNWVTPIAFRDQTERRERDTCCWVRASEKRPFTGRERERNFELWRPILRSTTAAERREGRRTRTRTNPGMGARWLNKKPGCQGNGKKGRAQKRRAYRIRHWAPSSTLSHLQHYVK